MTDSEKLEGRSPDGSQFSHSKLGDENGDNLKSKGVLTNLKVPTRYLLERAFFWRLLDAFSSLYSGVTGVFIHGQIGS